MSSDDPIPVISLIGGIGSGKSAISQELAKRCAVFVINADHVAHEVLTNTEVIDQLRVTLGPDVVNDSGEIIRSRVADRVFGDTPTHHAALKQLEEIVHPRTRTRIENTIREIREANSCKLIILDAPLLLEAGWDQVCDLVFYIDVAEEIRLQRVTQTRNWTEDEFRRREQNQLGLSDKKKRADYTIDNNADLDRAVDQLETCLKQHFKLTF